MKQVLLIDDSAVFRDYLKEKLESHHIALNIGLGQLDSISKIRSIMPDLIIIDFTSSRNFLLDILEMKRRDPNARDVPVFLLAQKIEKREIVRLSEYGIKKIISKPLKIDQLLSEMTSILGIDFDIDETPCILEARVNDNIIFIEIAQGLNRDKIDLLKFRIRELIDLYNIPYPKILVMMTDLSLSFVDAPNLELLMNNITSSVNIKNRNLKILTLDGFIREFLCGNKEYADIQIVTDLTKAIDSLLKDVLPTDDASTLISERILSVDETQLKKGSSLEMRFRSEVEAIASSGRDIRIAVVDDDVVIRTVLTKTFQAIKAKVEQFESGDRFLPQGITGKFDLVFLDLMMPGMNGFEVLRNLRAQGVQTPIIVLSAVSQREAVLKVLSTGVKSYMIKPLKPDTILKKTIEVLQTAFNP